MHIYFLPIIFDSLIETSKNVQDSSSADSTGTVHFTYKPSFRKNNVPVCLIKDDYLMPTFWKSDLLLGKHFDFVSHNINASGTIIEMIHDELGVIA